MKKTNLLIITVTILFSSCSVNKHTVQTTTGNPTFLLLSDIHLDTFTDSSSYGNDTGLGLWKIFLTKADSLLGSTNAPQFVVYTGDLPAHYSCSGNCYLPVNARQTHNTNLAAILSGLRDLVTKHHTALFYVPGNNDAIAGNYYSFADSSQNTLLSLIPESVNPYPALNINPGGDTAPCMISNTQPTMGYYSAKPIDGLRIIALNTVIFSRKFTAVDGTNPVDDGIRQLKWLNAQLKDAADKGDKVYIAMHIPPGIDAYQYTKTPDNAGMWARLPDKQNSWLNGFLAIVDQYQHTIAGILYGHTHMDELRRLYDITGTRMTAIAISAPGITPQHDNNPGFKLVQYDKQSKDLLDFTTYYTTPSAGTWGNATYSFNSVFGFPPGNTMYKNLSTASITAITTQLNKIFTVMNGPSAYSVQPGIEVKPGQ